MSQKLDATYRSQRMRLLSTVNVLTMTVWSTSWRDREETIGRVVPIVESGQAQIAALTDAYMAAALTEQGVSTRAQGVDRGAYTIEKLRNRSAVEVYDRPYGALAGQLQEGAEFAAAYQSAQAMLKKLVSTDIQLAQTHSARDWMMGSRNVAGYRRVLGPGRNCGLCVAASTQRYWKADLMAIHENCHCSVAPIAGIEPVARSINPEAWELVASEAKNDVSRQALSRLKFDNEKLPDVLVIRPDPELGMRLLDQRWRTGEASVVDSGGKRASR